MMSENAGHIMLPHRIRPRLDERFDLTISRSAVWCHDSRSVCLPTYPSTTNREV